jgi:hypothetical protein
MRNNEFTVFIAIDQNEIHGIKTDVVRIESNSGAIELTAHANGIIVSGAGNKRLVGYAGLYPNANAGMAVEPFTAFSFLVTPPASAEEFETVYLSSEVV